MIRVSKKPIHESSLLGCYKLPHKHSQCSIDSRNCYVFFLHDDHKIIKQVLVEFITDPVEVINNQSNIKIIDVQDYTIEGSFILLENFGYKINPFVTKLKDIQNEKPQSFNDCIISSPDGFNIKEIIWRTRFNFYCFKDLDFPIGGHLSNLMKILNINDTWSELPYVYLRKKDGKEMTPREILHAWMGYAREKGY